MEDHTETYESEEFRSNVFKAFKAMREEGILFDFTINIDGISIPTHKLLLASSSDYFKAMFTNNTLESQQGKVLLQDIHKDAIKSLLDFCYTAKIKLSTENVQEILKAACLLQFPEVKSYCSEFLRERTNIPNCLGIAMQAERYNLRELYEPAFKFCLENFELLILEKEFMDAESEWISNIISQDDLNITDESIVYEAVIKWTQHDPESRRSKLDDLMSHVRFPFIKTNKLISIGNNELMRSSVPCRDLVDEAKNFLLQRYNPEGHRESVDWTGPRFKPRNSTKRHQRIYAVGGWTNEFKPIPNTECYDPFSDQWTEMSAMTRPRCGVGVAIIGDSLYAIGGHDGQNYLKSVERYNVKENIWYDDVCEMHSERTSVGVVALNGHIYAIGGQIGSNSSALVEKYDPKTNTWKQCAQMREKRLGAGVTTLGGMIYVLGGASGGGSDGRVLNSVECYNPEKNKWTSLPPMSTTRKHLGCASYRGKLYAVGGRGDSSELDSGEFFNVKKNIWQPIPPMSEKRSGIGLVEMDGLIYAVGGHNGDLRLNLVEMFDGQSWTTRSPMIHERLGMGLVVYKKLTRSENDNLESLSSLNLNSSNHTGGLVTLDILGHFRGSS